MMKKIGQYYATVFKKFGILIPVLGIAAAYVILILMERNNVFSALIHASKTWFIVLAAVGCAALVAGAVYVYLKLKAPQVNVLDLCLFAVTALALLMLVMFCFAPGAGFMGVFKWTVVAVVFVAGLVLSFFRVKFVD
ncbi:MAG: hypothetical protein IJD76_04115 [Bacilli bacterium]|nr:hypothetical protein [Bacilli bacterium]